MMDDEKFFAWLDGELSSAEAAEMEAKVAADPELAGLAEQHRALGARLTGAFDPLVEWPRLPERRTLEAQRTVRGAGGASERLPHGGRDGPEPSRVGRVNDERRTIRCCAGTGCKGEGLEVASASSSGLLRIGRWRLLLLRRVLGFALALGRGHLLKFFLAHRAGHRFRRTLEFALRGFAALRG